MSSPAGALYAVLYREGKIRSTNLTFIFWDLFFPLGYLLVFGVGVTRSSTSASRWSRPRSRSGWARWFREVAMANPITWQVDVLRYATVGVGDGTRIAIEGAAFVVFSLLTFAGATWALRNQE